MKNPAPLIADHAGASAVLCLAADSHPFHQNNICLLMSLSLKGVNGPLFELITDSAIFFYLQ